jgi:hypothetical protein
VEYLPCRQINFNDFGVDFIFGIGPGRACAPPTLCALMSGWIVDLHDMIDIHIPILVSAGKTSKQVASGKDPADMLGFRSTNAHVLLDCRFSHGLCFLRNAPPLGELRSR